MNYDDFRAAWDEALRRANLLSFHDHPEEVIDTKAMARRYIIRLGMTHPQPAEPFFGSMELRWEWDALKSARTQTIEEDVVVELLGRADAQNIRTERPWLRVDISLAGKLPLGKPLILPTREMGAWVAETIRRVDPLLFPSGRSKSGALPVDSWRGEPEAQVQFGADGELWLLGVELAAWQAITLPRQWDDREVESDEPPQLQLEAFAQRLHEALQAWKDCLKALVPSTVDAHLH
jgi:hypothetical protein